MKNFKNLIKEAHLGNPLNEEDRATRVDKMMSGEYDDEDYKDSKRYADVRADLDEEIDDEDIVIYDGEEHIIMRKDGNMVYIRPLEDSAILGKRDEIKVPARALAYKSDLDKMYDEYKPKDEMNEVDEKWDKIARDEYGKPWMELSIAQKQEMLSYANRETEKQFQTDYERRRKGDYSDDMKDGMTDYERRSMGEDINENTLGDLVKKYGKDLINFVIDIDELTKDEIKDVEYLDDRIQIHLEEPEIRQKYLPEGTCGYTPDGEPRSKPAGPDLNEDEIPMYLTSNDAFKKAVEDSVSYNDFEKRVYGILGPKYFKLAKIENPGAMKDYYDSVRVTRPSMEEAFDLDIDDAHGGEGELDNAVARMGYNESLKKSLKESLNKRLGK